MRGDRLLDAGLRFGNALRIAKDVEAGEARIEQDGLRLELLQTSSTPINVNTQAATWNRPSASVFHSRLASELGGVWADSMWCHWRI